MHGGKPEYTNTVLHCTPLHSTSTVVLRPTLSHSTLHARHKEEKGSDSNPPVTPAKQGEGIPPPSWNSHFPFFPRFFLSFFISIFSFLFSFPLRGVLSLSLPISLVSCDVSVSSYFLFSFFTLFRISILSSPILLLLSPLLYPFLSSSYHFPFDFVPYIHFILTLFSSMPSPLSLPISLYPILLISPFACHFLHHDPISTTHPPPS